MAALMARPQRDSSVAVYENHWRCFAVWLQSKSLALADVDSTVIASYLHSHFLKALQKMT